MSSNKIDLFGPGLFPLGDVTITPGIRRLSKVDRNVEQQLLDWLMSHHNGIWGDLCPDDIQENEKSLQNGGRLMSAYQYNNYCKVWVITEASREVTTVLLPEEY